MIAHQIEAGARQWPRTRNMPRCPLCSDSMVAPEAASVLQSGEVSYLWSCDSCGQGFVTQARTSATA